MSLILSLLKKIMTMITTISTEKTDLTAKQTSTDGKKASLCIDTIRDEAYKTFVYKGLLTDVRIFDYYEFLWQFNRAFEDYYAERYLDHIFTRLYPLSRVDIEHKYIVVIGTRYSVDRFFSCKAYCLPKDTKLAVDGGYFSLFVYEDVVLFIELYMIRKLPEIEHLFGKEIRRTRC